MCLCVLRNDRALRARLPYAAPRCSCLLGRSEHTCGTRAQREDSVGFKLTTLQHFCVSKCSTTEPSPTSLIELYWRIASASWLLLTPAPIRAHSRTLPHTSAHSRTLPHEYLRESEKSPNFYLPTLKVLEESFKKSRRIIEEVIKNS